MASRLKRKDRMLGGLAALLMGGSAWWACKDDMHLFKSPAPMEQYIENRYDLENPFNPTRTFYLILQEHALYGHGLDKETEKAVRDKVLPNQISIYRILEGLHKKGLQMVCIEGPPYNYMEDIENPLASVSCWGDDQFFKEAYSGNDKALGQWVKLWNSCGATAASRFYPGLYGVGFTEENCGVTEGKILNAKDDEERKRLTEIGRKDRIIRSHDSIKYARIHADRLYEQGLIRNRDVAIVIGAGHFEDYWEHIDQIPKGNVDYNMVVITPTNMSRKYFKSAEKKPSK